jgi:hypothetical protein
MIEQKHWVMDYETLSDCFLGVFENYNTDETHVFTIGALRNDLPKIGNFFQQNIDHNEWHISFNGLGFDSQITQFIIENFDHLSTLGGVNCAKAIYAEAQDAINRSNNREFSKYPEWKLAIKQIDIFKLNHWDNPAKASSLKWIQCSMDWHNVQDMPIDHTESITTVSQLQEIAKYCRNDVSSTKAVMKLCKKQIELRQDLSKEYNLNLFSASEPRISKEIFMFFLENAIQIPKRELKQMRTFRNEIKVKDILLPYLQFEGVKVFDDLHAKFKDLIVDGNNTKGAFKYSVEYRGVKTDFGLGGVHGAKRGIYEEDEHMMIMSSDVTSFYPNLAIRNKWSPGHLPADEFCELYEWFFEERKKIPKSDPRNYVYKIVLNSTYGLSNDQNSFLYDPELTMRITINGQLSLMMLYVMLVENIPGAIPIMQNTDGLETLIPRKYEQKYLEICSKWEQLTSLQLEHDTYQKLIVPDVNNYIGINSFKEVEKEEFRKLLQTSPELKFKREDGKCYIAKTKCKGRFEFLDRALHKNKSFTVVSKALYYYFVHDIQPEDYIKTNKNIFDYCGQVKAKGNWKFKALSVTNQKFLIEDVQKTLRYFVSNKGCKIVKKNTSDDREINVEAGKWLQTIFNEYEEKEFLDYNINLSFYLDKINKEIKQMSPELFRTQYQLEL